MLQKFNQIKTILSFQLLIGSSISHLPIIGTRITMSSRYIVVYYHYSVSNAINAISFIFYIQNFPTV